MAYGNARKLPPISPAFTIRHDPDPILREVCSPVTEAEFGPDLVAFAEKVVEFAATLDGYGIAGPQIGINKRMFVMQNGPKERGFLVCNPHLTLSIETIDKEEGCLSMPGVQGQVTRSAQVHMTYQTPLGEIVSVVLDGLMARVAQHETDHLDGIMFYDRMPRNPRRQVLRDWEKIEQRLRKRAA